MILANCHCHTVLSAFSMPNEASLDHNWHSWKIHRQTCFPIIFNCQTFCTNKCCCTLRSRRARAGCAALPSWLHLKRLETWGRVAAELLLSAADLKSPSAPLAGLIVALPSSLWFGLKRKSRRLWLMRLRVMDALSEQEERCSEFSCRWIFFYYYLFIFLRN